MGSSYMALPLNLKIFNQCFRSNNNDKRHVNDFILTLGATLNRCGSVMGVLVVVFILSIFNNYELSWKQLSLAPLVALVGIGSPGIHGGTLLASLSTIMQILSPPDPEKFVFTAISIYVASTTFVQVAVNTVINGYVTILVNCLSRVGSQLK